MYTVEFESDAVVVTILDDIATCEDIRVIITDDDIVFITQYEDGLDESQVITITYAQLLDLVAALHSPEGAFYVKQQSHT